MSHLTQREQQVLELIADDPLLSQQAVADALGISRSAVAGHIMKLTDKGVIKGRGYVVSEAPFVVAVGGANIDIHGGPTARLRRRDSNPGRVQTSPGGVARNIAENLARLDVDCRLIAPLGTDYYGDLLLRQGREAGIDMRHSFKVDSQSTSTYLSVLDESGDMLLAISDMAILDALDGRVLEKHEKMLLQAAAIVVDLNIGDDALAYLANHCAQRPIFVDTVSTTKAVRIRPYLGVVHTLFPSLIEAEALSGLKGRSDRSLERMADWFHQQGTRQVCITLGKNGAFFSGDGLQARLAPVGAGTVVNAGGAGDAFAAGMIAAWLQDHDPQGCVRFAMAAAAHTLRDEATVSPGLSVGTVQAIIEERDA